MAYFSPTLTNAVLHATTAAAASGGVPVPCTCCSDQGGPDLPTTLVATITTDDSCNGQMFNIVYDAVNHWWAGSFNQPCNSVVVGCKFYCNGFGTGMDNCTMFALDGTNCLAGVSGSLNSGTCACSGTTLSPTLYAQFFFSGVASCCSGCTSYYITVTT